MPKDFKCALPSRAGRTLLLGSHRIEIDRDGFARGVGDDVLSYFQSQPGIWLEVLPSGEVKEPVEVLLSSPPALATPVAGPRARTHEPTVLAEQAPAVTLPKAEVVQLPSCAANVTLPSKAKRRGKKGSS